MRLSCGNNDVRGDRGNMENTKPRRFTARAGLLYPVISHATITELNVTKSRSLHDCIAVGNSLSLVHDMLSRRSHLDRK